jgi:hypothetical protein
MFAIIRQPKSPPRSTSRRLATTRLGVEVLEDRVVLSYSYIAIDVPGADSTGVSGINDAGEIVGSYTDSSGNHGFLRSGGSYLPINVPFPGAYVTSVYGINDAGQIVGSYFDGFAHGFLRSGGSYLPIDPGPFPGAFNNTAAFGINDAGQIMGTYRDASNIAHGFLLSGGGYTAIDVPGALNTSGSGTTARGINDAGQIVGLYIDSSYDGGLVPYHGFLLSGGGYTAIDVPGASQTFATGINDAGQIVGTYVDADGHGFLLSGGSYTAIDVPFPGAYGTSVVGINDAGQIVGSYNDSSGRHSFLATPDHCQPGDQFDVDLPPNNFILPPLPPKLSLPTIHLDEFNATFNVQAPAPSDQGAICSASANTDTNGGNPTTGRFIEVGPNPFLTSPVAFATVQVTVTLFQTAPSSVALGAPPPYDSRLGTLLTGAHNVWLNDHDPAHAVLQWYTPGFKTFLLNPLGSPIQIADTGPLEDWVDIPNATGTSFATIVSQAEQLIESRNSVIVFQREVLPFLPLLAIFDPGQTDLLVTGPNGNQTGVTENGMVVKNLPGSAYFPSVPLAVIAAPSAGTYQTQVHGLASGTYELVTALLNQDQVLAQQSFSGPIAAGLTVDYLTSVNPQRTSLSTSLVLTQSLVSFQFFIDRLEATGGITNHGVANSLRSKLANAHQELLLGHFDAVHGILGAFISEVHAQSGKKITVEAADDLMAFASFLLDFVL